MKPMMPLFSFFGAFTEGEQVFDVVAVFTGSIKFTSIHCEFTLLSIFISWGP